MKFNLSNVRQIKNYSKNLKNRIQNIQNDFLDQVNKNLHIYTPVRTGRLVNGYIVNYNQKNITNNVEYLPYVNYGTSRQVGQHFVQISYKNAIMKLPNIVRKYKE